MRQASLVVLSLLALLMGGCQFFGGGEPEATETEAATPTISPVDPNAVPTPPTDGASPEAFAEPTVAGSPPPPPSSIPPDLIASTSSASRIQQIQGKGADPFAPLAVTPIVTIPPAPPTPPPAAESPRDNQPSNNRNNNNNNNNGAAASQPEPKPTPPPPPPPRTTEAQNVEVTGVVQVGSQVFAIVKAPGEPTSRYVQEGQSLNNGQVLVKRIEVGGPEPIVVLQQSGVEIARIVGGAVETAEAANLAQYTPPM